jgi:O-antigen/teichoic acid export membrane protein
VVGVAESATGEIAMAPPPVVDAPFAGACEPRPASTLGRHLREWTGILSAYFTAQTLTQLAGIFAGILLVRFLPVRQFALYTLAASVLTFFTFVSDLGSTSSLVYFFRLTKKEGGDFRRYVSAVLSLRRIAFLVGAAAVLAIFPSTARTKGFSWVEIALVTAGIIAATWFQIVSSLRLLILRLHGRYGQSYRAELAGGAIRVAAVLLMIAAAVLRAWVAVVGVMVATAVVARLAASAEGRPAAAHGLEAQRRKILRYLLPTLPNALYFSIQGPLIIWLSATFGNTRNIAEVGALARLGTAVGLFSGLTGVVFLPRLAAITDDRLYRTRYFQYGALLLAIAGSLLAAAWLAPRLFLLVLGPKYSGLQRELLLVVGGAGLTMLGGYAVGTNTARSWNRLQVLTLAIEIATQVTLVLVLPLSTTTGVLTFTLLSSFMGLSLQVATSLLGFREPRWVLWS